MQQLGDYFYGELTRLFGFEPEIPEIPINESFIKTTNLFGAYWQYCDITNSYEGIHNGLRFSVANVQLTNRVQGTGEDASVRTEVVFGDIVLRCKDICNPALDITLRNPFPVDTLTPQLHELIQMLETFVDDSKVAALILHNGELTLALNTSYAFAHILAKQKLRDINGIRKSYTDTLTAICRLIDLLRDSCGKI